jgi:hypothetical protein
MKGFPQICFIENTVLNPNVIIGDYTYYVDPEDSEDFQRNVLYHFPFIGDRLIIIVMNFIHHYSIAPAKRNRHRVRYESILARCFALT